MQRALLQQHLQACSADTQSPALSADSLTSSSLSTPQELRSVASFLHVLHSKNPRPKEAKPTELDEDTFQRLVDYQVASRQPIRAPWFRDVRTLKVGLAMCSHGLAHGL